MKLVDLPLNTALPKDRARCACTAALRRQVALRLSRLDLEVFFLGAAIIFQGCLSTVFYSTCWLQCWEEAIDNLLGDSELLISPACDRIR